MPDGSLLAKPLDEWYRLINQIYLHRNLHRSRELLYCHLMEVIGGITVAINKGPSEDVNLEDFLGKSLAWWMALCGEAGVLNASALVWTKFPNICPYCRKNPHQDPCKSKGVSIDWQALRAGARPRPENWSLTEWQRMFHHIYPENAARGAKARAFRGDGNMDARAMVRQEERKILCRLVEEMGEMAEAIRIFPLRKGYFLNESADVFAWIMALANFTEDPTAPQSSIVARSMARLYPGKCRYCDRSICRCDTVEFKELIRIAKDVPDDVFRDLYADVFSENVRYLLMQQGYQEARVGGRNFPIGTPETDLLEKIWKELREVSRKSAHLEGRLAEHHIDAEAWRERDLATQRAVQDSLDALFLTFAVMQPEDKRDLLHKMERYSDSVVGNALYDFLKAILMSGIKDTVHA